MALLNDPQWLRFIGDRKVNDAASARAWIESRLVAAYRAHGFGLWALQRRSDGELLGMCGLVRRDGLPEIDLGYAHWGHFPPEVDATPVYAEPFVCCLPADHPLAKRKQVALATLAAETPQAR